MSMISASVPLMKFIAAATVWALVTTPRRA